MGSASFSVSRESVLSRTLSHAYSWALYADKLYGMHTWFIYEVFRKSCVYKALSCQSAASRSRDVTVISCRWAFLLLTMLDIRSITALKTAPPISRFSNEWRKTDGKNGVNDNANFSFRRVSCCCASVFLLGKTLGRIAGKTQIVMQLNFFISIFPTFLTSKLRAQFRTLVIIDWQNIFFQLFFSGL